MIISTAKPVSLEEALDIAEERAYNKARPSFPPIDDAVKTVKSIDWNDLVLRFRKGTGTLLLFAMAFSEKSFEFHNNLYDRYFSFTNDGPDLNS